MPFYLDQGRDLAVAQIPRCGINTISEWLGRDAVVVNNDDHRLLAVSRRVAFIRNPLERLKSAFSLFYWSYDYRGIPHRSGAPIDSWESFIDHVLDPNIRDDEHWLPQTTHVGNVPNVYHRFENILEKFETYRPGILPHNAKTSRRPTPDYRLSELAAKYSNDMILWNGID